MNTSGDRLRILLKECNLSAADFAAHRNVTSQHINNWFTRGVPAARMDEIAELLSVRSHWLRHGKGPKYTSPFAVDCNYPTAAPYRTAHSPCAAVPPSIEHFASQPDDILIPFHVPHESHLLHRQNTHLRLPRIALASAGVSAEHSCALLMPDHSMLDRLHPGSALTIDRSLTHIVDGQPYAMMFQGELHVRYLYRLPDGGLRLRSQNFIDYPDQSLTARESGPRHLEVLGWMFWHGTFSTKRPL
ncbi:LexA family transcriptional regulator [Pseudomonas sp. dw_358]|uniref:LexA family transcriptional regulator n=1 Tax=Pseudomonas sp. dw_358 TaxID=2720083 RepID=UPI001BD60AC7|nr:LexA family transcriptional regulator [Pseudomonas sp. dw_358]